MKMTAISAFIVLLSIGTCCDHSSRRVSAYYNFGDDYVLRLVSLVEVGGAGKRFGSANVPAQTISPFEHRGLILRVYDERYGFFLDLANTTALPVSLLWSEARYIDEIRRAHEVFQQQMGALPEPEKMKVSTTVIVQPGERVRDVIAPIYKSYWIVEDCDTHVPFREPLVPTTLAGRSREQMKTYVDDLARRQVPVKLVLPMEIEGMRYDYTFTFVLKDRWSDLPKQ